ncbi:protein NUCLEAR FUSION DEFECTIVE 2 [Triticum aestivum]|uniref:protein NUCLEAR FUSION DEFECTIVE 2 n=1 Tax=Triticum aestivum TaxID=4565 RepID=UPI0008427386|nr:protein NUCLEAR FUSION DEFECTIVE 2-like [Triticum aestivum]
MGMGNRHRFEYRPGAQGSSSNGVPAAAVLLLLLVPVSHPLASGLESSPFDAALAALQGRMGYAFRSPDLLRRAMTHASYSRENGRALAVLGLAAAESAAALRALAADRDAPASAVSRAARDAAGEPACAAAGARAGIPGVVRVAGSTKASAPPVVCGALRALLGAVAVDNGTAAAAAEVFWRLHVITAAAM